MMNACRVSILIVTLCLAVNGCQLGLKPEPDVIPPAEEQILLDSGSVPLAGELEKARPLVDLGHLE